MKVPLSWLREYVEIDLSPKELAHRLTMAGAEVVEVPVYRWVPPADVAPMDRVTDGALCGSGCSGVAVTFM